MTPSSVLADVEQRHDHAAEILDADEAFAFVHRLDVLLNFWA
jgi:hypothetical protein